MADRRGMPRRRGGWAPWCSLRTLGGEGWEEVGTCGGLNGLGFGHDLTDQGTTGILA